MININIKFYVNNIESVAYGYYYDSIGLYL